MSDDYIATTGTAGRVVVGRSATGVISSPDDRDWFAVDLVAGRTYTVDLRGSPTNHGTLRDTVLRGIRDSDGALVISTYNDDGGHSTNSRVTFTATESGVHYIEAASYGYHTGSYEVAVTDRSPPGTTAQTTQLNTEAALATPGATEVVTARADATDLGDITALEGPRFPRGTINGVDDNVDYYRFTLTAEKQVVFGLRQQDADADLFIEDGDGVVLHSGTASGTVNEAVSATLLAGTYYVRIEAQEAGDSSYVFRYGVTSGADEVARLQQQQEAARNVAPSFAQQSYTFTLAENADGSANGVSLGAVTASDPENSTLTYRIAAGNAAGLFAVDAATGTLSYTGLGEDYESGATQHTLTVRASDGTLHTDTAVTVNVTDTAEAPVFAQQSYTFTLAENADGSANGVSLGAVTASDPENSTLTYRIAAGNAAGLFAVDAATGTLSYTGLGEDYESGATQHTLTVRASDGTLHTDTAVTVNVTDTAEAPVFAQQSYTFTLAENADGSANGVSLGAVTASDPENSTLTYRIAAGNAAGLFAVDAATGTLSYTGLGEDYESGATQHTLTVRASDGTLHTDTAVTVNVTDTAEAPVFAQQSYTFTLAENADGSANGVSLGAVTASDPENSTLTYRIAAGNAAGLFAVDAATGTLSYTGLGEDYESGATQHTLTVRASDGTLHTDTAVTVNVTDEQEAALATSGATEVVTARADATDLGDITALEGPRFPRGTINGVDDNVDYYRFTLTAEKQVVFGLRQQDADADLFIEDGDGVVLHSGTASGTVNEAVSATLLAGTYYVRIEAQEAGDSSYVFRYGVTSGADEVARLQQQQEAARNVAPSFAQQSYTFTLAENADGSANGVSLGAVTASDPENSTLTYRIAAGNAAGLFAVDAATGTLSYTGLGEDYESGATQHTLTVRASDGTLHTDTAVTVNVTDEQEATLTLIRTDDYTADESGAGSIWPGVMTIGEVEVAGDRDWFAVNLVAGLEYSFDLKGNPTSDGTLANPRLRGLYDSDGVLVAGTGNDDISPMARNARFLFTPETSGVYYVDAGASGEGVGTYTLSVAKPNPIILQQISAPAPSDDYLADTTTTGRVSVGGLATGKISRAGDQDWFAVTLEAGIEYRIDLAGKLTGNNKPLYDPYLRGIYDSSGTLISGTTDDDSGPVLNSRVYYSPESSGTYYIAAGGYGSSPLWDMGHYALSVTDVGNVDDYSADMATTGRVSVGGETTGEIHKAGDRDWFAVRLEAETEYRVDLKGYGLDNGSLRDPYLSGIHSSRGDAVAGTTDDSSGYRNNSMVFFTPNTSGTYYIAAGAGGANTGDYTLSVAEVGDDDYSADTTTTGIVSVGGSAMGEIEKAGDRDWFAVTLEAGIEYRIDLEREAADGDKIGDPYLAGIHDSRGMVISGTTDAHSGLWSTPRVFFTPETTETYYIATAGLGSSRGDYNLKVRVNGGADDYSADKTTTGRVSVDGSTDGKIEGFGDRDWFSVTLEAGIEYRIDISANGANNDTLYDPYLYGIHDSRGTLIPGTTDDDSGFILNSRLFFTPETAGTYYIAAGGRGSLEIMALGNYTVSVTQRDDYFANTETTGSVSVDGLTTGDIEEQGDRDWFAVELVSGAEYRIELLGSVTGFGTLRDTYLHGIYDSSGVKIAHTTDDDGGLWTSSMLLFTPKADGTYYIAAGGDNGNTGTYTVYVTAVGSDDYSADTGRAGQLSVDGLVVGNIEKPKDKDWFAATLDAGAKYQIDLEGSRTGNGTLYDPYLYGIHDSDGTAVFGTENDDGGYRDNARVIFTPNEDGTYYIATGSASVSVAEESRSTGTYKLSLTQLDDHLANIETKSSVAVDGFATGDIEQQDDQDWFAIELVSGKEYRIEILGSATSFGTLQDPYLRGIYDSNGAKISGTTDDDGGFGSNSLLEFTPTVGGTYYIAASGDGTNTGTYTVSATVLGDDDYSANKDTSGLVSVDGSTAGKIEKPGDRDWFATTLEAGTEYRIDLEGSNTVLGTLLDPYLYGIHGSNGKRISGTEDNDNGYLLNSQVIFTPKEDGTYYIVAGSGNTSVTEEVLSTGTYTLSIDEI